MEPSRKPLNLLVKRVNSEVNVKLKNNIEYRGRMVGCDGHMNVILEGATRYKNDSPTANLGNVVLRGSYILYISVEEHRAVNP